MSDARWTFTSAELDEALAAYQRQGEGAAEARQQISDAVRAFLASPYGQCLRDRTQQTGASHA